MLRLCCLKRSDLTGYIFPCLRNLIPGSFGIHSVPFPRGFLCLSSWIWCLGPSPSTVSGLGSLPACSTAVLLHQCRVFCHPSLLPWPPPGVGTAWWGTSELRNATFSFLCCWFWSQSLARGAGAAERLWAAAFGGKERPQELCCSWQWVEELKGGSVEGWGKPWELVLTCALHSFPLLLWCVWCQ